MSTWHFGSVQLDAACAEPRRFVVPVCSQPLLSSVDHVPASQIKNEAMGYQWAKRLPLIVLLVIFTAYKGAQAVYRYTER